MIKILLLPLFVALGATCGGLSSKLLGRGVAAIMCIGFQALSGLMNANADTNSIIRSLPFMAFAIGSSYWTGTKTAGIGLIVAASTIFLKYDSGDARIYILTAVGIITLAMVKESAPETKPS